MCFDEFVPCVRYHFGRVASRGVGGRAYPDKDVSSRSQASQCREVGVSAILSGGFQCLHI